MERLIHFEICALPLGRAFLLRARRCNLNFYISDLHFGHKNALAFDNRPFGTVDEMNQALIDNWNKTVTAADHVYILGDFCWGKAKDWPAVLQQLSGNKHLIRGNHDIRMPMQPDVRRYFVDVADYKEIKDGDQYLVLSHYPIVAFKNMYYGWMHLYGHVHVTTEEKMVSYFFRTVERYYEFPQRAFNVGCMLPYMNYTPRTLEEIVEGGRQYGLAGGHGAAPEVFTEKAAEESEA